MNRSGLTLSAATATLVSLPAAAMLFSLPGTATAHAATSPPAATVPAVAAPAGTANCNCAPVYDAGAGHSVTALSSTGNGKVAYAAWIAGGDDHGQGAPSGIATNYGGSWHQAGTEGLPQQAITGITVDPSNAAHAYAVYDEHSRRGDGHVFETWNGGRAWGDISGNLPDLASIISLVLDHGRLALATNEGVYTAYESGGEHTCWNHLGSFRPNAMVDALTVGPEDHLYAAWAANRGDHDRGAPSGIATNYGGSWHQVGTEGLPKLHISGITIDPSNALHAYAVYNEPSRRCTCGGHVFETRNGGHSWADISGNLPGLASIISLVLDHGRLALATNEGVYSAYEFGGGHTSWLHLGSVRQHTAVYALTVGPNHCLYAATHGHGIWRFML